MKSNPMFAFDVAPPAPPIRHTIKVSTDSFMPTGGGPKIPTPSGSNASGSAPPGARTFGRRPSFNRERPRRPSGAGGGGGTAAPETSASASAGSEGDEAWFASAQAKLQKDLEEMTLKSRAAHATAQARQKVAEREKARHSAEVDSKVRAARERMAKQEAEDEAWLRYLFEQREREIRENIERLNQQRQREQARTPQEREAAARARMGRTQPQTRGATAPEWPAHEKQWLAFEQGAGGNLGSGDVPWPPEASGVITWNLQRVESGSEGRARVKEAYKKAALRWHPDKFTARFASRLAPSERDAIMRSVKDVFQAINASFSQHIAAL